MLKFLSEHPSPHTLQEASSYSPLFLLPNLIFLNSPIYALNNQFLNTRLRYHMEWMFKSKYFILMKTLKGSTNCTEGSVSTAQVNLQASYWITSELKGHADW